MPNIVEKEDSIYSQDDSIYGTKTRAVPVPEKGIGIDTKGDFVSNIVEAGMSSSIDISKIQSFTQVSQNRDQLYQTLDTMAEDPTISAVLETYAEDATEANDNGQIIWAESDEEEVGKFVTYLLDTMEVNKHIYKWTHALCKYGDIYLRLFRKSEFKDALFSNEDEVKESKSLNEDVNVKLFSNDDKYEHYIEMVSNPAEMFELTKFGKSYAYIQANVGNTKARKTDGYTNNSFLYSFKKRDVDVYDATTFVHASLEDNSSRVPEEVEIFLGETDEDTAKLSYKVRRGQSLLYNTFKIWRELMLLENSLLLNRLTKSSILRIIGVEVGDMPKENVGPHIMQIKNLIEQKAAVNVGNSMQEYTNPGPMENNIYVPTHNNIGAITTQEVGGDVNVKGLSDIDYFEDKLFGALRVPKQFFGRTDDNAGFSGGDSLALISSRYAKAVKRIQNTMVQAITDVINLMLLDKGLETYINKFELHMVAPTTKEEQARRESLGSKVNLVQDTMSLLDGIEDQSARLKILKIMISNVVNDSEILSIIQDQIDSLEEVEELGIDTTPDEDNFGDTVSHSGMHTAGDNINIDNLDISEPSSQEEPSSEESSDETILPSPSDLNIGDLGDNTNPALEA